MSQVGTCFLCSNTCSRGSVPLTSFQLPSSRQEAFYYLSELLGNKYFVVCGDDAVLCRYCTSLLVKVDQLEHELNTTKDVVLRHLEKKCQLKEGTLSVPQPKTAEPPNKAPTFLERKRAAEEANDEEPEESTDPRSRIMMECESCEYTCNYTSFVKRHVRPDACLQCGLILVNGSCPIRCSDNAVSTIAASPVTMDADSLCIPNDESLIVSDVGVLQDIPVQEVVSDGKQTYYHVVEAGQLKEVFAVNDTSDVSETSYAWDTPANSFLQMCVSEIDKSV